MLAAFKSSLFIGPYPLGFPCNSIVARSISIPTEKEDDFWANYFHHFSGTELRGLNSRCFLIRWHRMEMADADLCKNATELCGSFDLVWFIWFWFFVSTFLVKLNWIECGIAAFRYIQCVDCMSICPAAKKCSVQTHIVRTAPQHTPIPRPSRTSVVDVHIVANNNRIQWECLAWKFAGINPSRFWI